MADKTTTHRPPCPTCKRRRQRLRAHSPILNTLCAPVSRWGFTALAVGGFYAGLTIPALIAAALATFAWRHN